MQALGYFTAFALILIIASVVSGTLFWFAGKIIRLYPSYSSMVWCSGVSHFTNIVCYKLLLLTGHADLEKLSSVVSFIVLVGMLKRHTGAKIFPTILLLFVVALALTFGIAFIVGAIVFGLILTNR